MPDLSKVFGEAEKGVHAHTFLGTAIVDYLMTLALAMATTAATGVPVVLTTIAAMVLSVVAHAAFRVDTRTLRWIKTKLGSSSMRRNKKSVFVEKLRPRETYKWRANRWKR